jgi:hypothetical protein
MDELIRTIADRVTTTLQAIVSRLAVLGRERGDVPGWVLVTIMTAGLVTALWLVADDRLRELFGDALDGVVGDAP